MSQKGEVGVFIGRGNTRDRVDSASLPIKYFGRRLPENFPLASQTPQRLNGLSNTCTKCEQMENVSLALPSHCQNSVA